MNFIWWIWEGDPGFKPPLRHVASCVERVIPFCNANFWRHDLQNWRVSCHCQGEILTKKGENNHCQTIVVSYSRVHTVPNNSYRFWADLVLRWPCLGYDWHPWILIQNSMPTLYINCKFSWAKFHNFFIMENRKLLSYSTFVKTCPFYTL